MVSARWRKLAADLKASWGRTAMMLIAVAVSLTAVGSVLGSYAVLTREIAFNYLGTRPASATLELVDGIDASLVAQVRQHPLVQEAEAREVIVARARVGEEWRRMLLFVIDDFSDLRLNRFRPEQGAWPPPDGTMLLERSAMSMVNARQGDSVVIKAPHGNPRAVRVTGLVHDPGLAPAWQERSGYGYITRGTAEMLGESPSLHELRIELRDRTLQSQVIESQSTRVAGWLAERGQATHEIRVPPPAQHPHQRQMTSILLMMLAFSLMALVLSGILVASSLSALLARQVREIAVMKTLGARSMQIAGLYAVLVSLLGAASVGVALPASLLGTRTLTRAISGMLNFTLHDGSIPPWVLLVLLASGIVVPLLLSILPIRRASRITIREALDDHGVVPSALRTSALWMPATARNALRKPWRLALTLGLLSAAGAMFITAINVKRGWEANIGKIYETRSYDVEVLLQSPASPALVGRIERLRHVRKVETWGFSPAALARPGQVDVVRTYPDRGHGSLAIMGPPAATDLIRLPILAGRWLAPGDEDAVVLNHGAAAQAPHVKVGDTLSLSVDGRSTSWKVVGIVEEIGSAGVVYVTNEAFARAVSHEAGARMLRVATDNRTAQSRSETIRTIEKALGDEGVGIQSAVPLAELRTAMGDHILILIQTLMALAVILAIVGVLGLASTMGINVIERTRELGIMKTLGATPERILRMVVAEGTVVGLASSALAVGLSIPISALVDWVVGNLGFLAPLPLVLSGPAIVMWTMLATIGGAVATLVPARRAAGMPIHRALSFV